MTAFFAESIGTAILAFVIFALTHPKNETMKSGFVPPLIGLTVGCLISVLAPLTQAGFNPARDFGPRIVEMLPSGASSEEIAIFTERVLNNVVDANGLRTGDPRFDRLTAKFTEDFADGGIAGLETRQGLRFGGKAAKNILAKINKKMIQDAADDIFPTGDYKYDAEMVVESLVENNPKLFKNLLAEDLDDALRSELYGLAVGETGSRLAKSIKANRAGNVVDTNITEKVTPKGFSLNVEKAVTELNIPREEAVRISQLPSDQQKLELQKYLDKDFSQRIALTDYKPNKFDAAKGGLAKILEV